jgi:hypothetical protein
MAGTVGKLMVEPNGDGGDFSFLVLRDGQLRGIREPLKDGAKALGLFEPSFGVHGRDRRSTARSVKCSDEH